MCFCSSQRRKWNAKVPSLTLKTLFWDPSANSHCGVSSNVCRSCACFSRVRVPSRRMQRACASWAANRAFVHIVNSITIQNGTTRHLQGHWMRTNLRTVIALRQRRCNKESGCWPIDSWCFLKNTSKSLLKTLRSASRRRAAGLTAASASLPLDSASDVSGLTSSCWRVLRLCFGILHAILLVDWCLRLHVTRVCFNCFDLRQGIGSAIKGAGLMHTHFAVNVNFDNLFVFKWVAISFWVDHLFKSDMSHSSLSSSVNITFPKKGLRASILCRCWVQWWIINFENVTLMCSA